MRIVVNERKLRNIIDEVLSRLLSEAASLDDIYSKYYSDIEEKDFRDIIKADPTYRTDAPEKMGQYGKWLLSMFIHGKLKKEDLYKVKEDLTLFDKLKRMRKINKNDIGSYKTLQELYDAVEPYSKDETIVSRHDKKVEAKKDAEKVYEDSDWIVIVPHTKEAAQYYGKGTRWCTSADDENNYFDNYNRDGNLYININKHTGKKYQFHFESDSFMDERDVDISPAYQVMSNIEGLVGFYREMYFPGWVKLIFYATDDHPELPYVVRAEDGLWYVCNDKDIDTYLRSGSFDEEGYDEILRCDYNKYFIVQRDNKWGVLDDDGLEILPCEYDKIVQSESEKFSVEKDDIWYEANAKNGEYGKIPFTSMKKEQISSEVRVITEPDGYKYIINQEGEKLANTPIAFVKSLEKDMFYVVSRSGSYCNIISSKGELMVDSYEGEWPSSITNVGRGVIGIVYRTKSGVYYNFLSNGRLLLDEPAPYATRFDEGFAIISYTAGRYYPIDTDGKRLNDNVYDNDELVRGRDGRQCHLLRRGGKKYRLDHSGKETMIEGY